MKRGQLTKAISLVCEFPQAQALPASLLPYWFKATLKQLNHTYGKKMHQEFGYFCAL